VGELENQRNMWYVFVGVVDTSCSLGMPAKCLERTVAAWFLLLLFPFMWLSLDWQNLNIHVYT